MSKSHETAGSERTPHLEDQVIAGVAAGEAMPGTVPHLARCPTCSRRLEELREMVSLLAEVQALPEPPAWFRTRALAALRRRRERGSAWAGFLRLIADSLLAPAPGLVRGPVGPGRQLRLAGRRMELDLRLVPASEEAQGRVTGQVHLRLARGPQVLAGLKVQIVDGRGAGAEAELDRFGLFSTPGDFQPPLIVTVRSRTWTEEAFVPEAPG